MFSVTDQRKDMGRFMREQEIERKNFPTLPIVLCVLAASILAVYGWGIWHYQNRFVKGTVIDGVDVSDMTVSDFQEEISEYVLQVEQRKSDGSILEEDIRGEEIGLSYASVEPLQKILENQNLWLWFLKQDRSHETEGLLTWDEQALKKAVGDLEGFRYDFIEKPEDAYISDYIPGQGFEIVEEKPGNQLDRAKTVKAVEQAVSILKEQLNLEEADCYEKPGITSGDEQLVTVLAKLQKYGDIKITYTFGENKEILDGSLISDWLHVDGLDATLDRAQVEEYVASLRKKYDTIFRSRTFRTSYDDKEITIAGGDYGWWMDYGKEAEELADMIERGESGERTPVYHQTAAAYGTPDYGNTYVEINLTAQHLFVYQDGELKTESDFVSGNSSRGYDTPEGVYGITYKQRNATLVGETYQTPVSYWMPFNKNIGMHDATWRSSFGGNIYRTNGSHGCINLPYQAAQEIYGYIEKGTPVICYHLPGTEPAGRKSETPVTPAAPEPENGTDLPPEPLPETPPVAEELPEAVPASGT